jgi:hypothetical protein
MYYRSMNMIHASHPCAARRRLAHRITVGVDLDIERIDRGRTVTNRHLGTVSLFHSSVVAGCHGRESVGA